MRYAVLALGCAVLAGSAAAEFYRSPAVEACRGDRREPRDQHDL